MRPINKKTCIDQLYLTQFGVLLAMVYGRSEAEALQRAIQHFRPNKRKRDQVKVLGTTTLEDAV